MKKHILAAIILVSMLFTGCDANAGTTSLTINETAAEITEVTRETIHMNNCGGKGDAKQTAERSKSVNIEFSGLFGVGNETVKGEVSAKYSTVKETAKKLELVAPAKTNMEFVIEWTEKTWVGIVTEQGKYSQANYKVSAPISVELISSRDLGDCDSGLGPSIPCPYQSDTDTQTFINFIHAEEEAALTKNMNIIKTIYFVNATVRDASTNETSDPITHYQGIFEALDFIQLAHFDFEVVKNTGNKAWVKASDTGTFIYTSTGEKQEYTSAPGASHFVFEKDNSGCWLISQFTKLAAGEAFP